MAGKDVDMMVYKLGEMQKLLGGPISLRASKEEDEFNRAKISLMELVNWLSKKQDERDHRLEKVGRTIGIIQAGVEIKDKQEDAEDQLQQMKDALKRQKKNPKKYPESQIEIKEKQLQNCTEMLKMVQNREEGGPVEDNDDKPMTLTELKFGLTGNRNEVTHASLRKISKEEDDAIQRFREKDRELESLIGQINEGLDVLRDKAEKMDNQIADQEEEIHDFEKVVNKTNKKMLAANARMKKILYEFARPSRFCMDIICLMILLGLVGVIMRLVLR
jgi:chromosome segregation ATPase